MGDVTTRLREHRLQCGFTQRELATRSGLRIDTISALERGQSKGITFWTLARLSEALDCEPGDILRFEDDGHKVPVLGGPDEDDLLRARRANPGRTIDGPSFIAELMKESAARRRHV